MYLLYIETFCRCVITFAFIFSFFGKIRDIKTFRQTIAHFALLPKWLHQPATVLFLSAEALVVILLLIGSPFTMAGYMLAAALLILFSLALGSVLIRKLNVSCSCFGPSATPIHPSDIVRNAGFIICSICGLIALNWNQHIPGLSEWSLMGLSAIAFILIWTQLGAIVQLFS